MLIPEHEKFHKIGPKDCAFKPEEKPAFVVSVVRQTSATGEQINIEVPILAGDSREEMQAKLGLAYSILQERLEDENKAVLRLNEESQKRREEERQRLEEERVKKAEEKRLAKLQKKGLAVVDKGQE